MSEPQDPRSSCTSRVVIGLFLVVTAALVVKCVVDPPPNPLSVGGLLGLGERPFDAQVWRASDPDKATPYAAIRDAMVGDLIESKLLDGMLRTEVGDLLGEPIVFGEAPVEQQTSYYYVLAPGLIDPWVFRVDFGADGRVTSYLRFNG